MRHTLVSICHTCRGTPAAIKYQFRVLSLCPGAVIPHITALLSQRPPCLDCRAETHNPSHPSLLSLCIAPAEACAYIPTVFQVK